MPSKQTNREFRHQDAPKAGAQRGGRPQTGRRPNAAAEEAPDMADAAGDDRMFGMEAGEEDQQDGGGQATTEQRGRGKAQRAGSNAGTRKPEHSRRDPADRKTAKPDVNLRRTSETAPLRTAMDTISECFTYCLDNAHVERQHLTSMLDAWDALNATSSLVARGSPHADAFRQAAAEVVKACEESCEDFDGDETMTACADVCREAYEHLVA